MNKSSPIFAALLAASVASAATYTWNPAIANGNWNDARNWLPATGYPKTGDTAAFSANTKARIVLTDSVTVGTLNLDAASMDLAFVGATGGVGLKNTNYNGFKVGTGNKATNSGTRLLFDNLAISVTGDMALESGATLVLTNGTSLTANGFYMRNTGTAAYNQGRLEVVEGSSLTTAAGMELGGDGSILIRDSTIECRGAFTFNYGSGTGGGSIRFEGTHPVLKVMNDNFRSQNNNAYVDGTDFDFVVPAGGFEEPPLQHLGNGQLNNTSTSTQNSMRLNVLPGSPALSAGTRTTCPLVYARAGMKTGRIATSGGYFSFTDATGESEATADAGIRFAMVTVGSGQDAPPRDVFSHGTVAPSVGVNHRTFTLTLHPSRLATAYATRATIYGSDSADGPWTASEPVAVTSYAGVPLSWTPDEIAFGKTYYLKAVLDTLDGAAVVHSETSAVYSAATRDQGTYTWQPVDGDWNGRWNDPAHWSSNKGADGIGHPSSPNSTAVFLAGCQATVTVAETDTAGALNFSAAGIDVTFAGDLSHSLTISGTPDFNAPAGAGSKVTFSGLSANGSFMFDIGAGMEFTLTNGAYLNITELRAYRGGTARFTGNSTASFARINLGGTEGAIFIDDADVTIRDYLYAPALADGGRIVFSGTHPRLYAASTGKTYFGANRSGGVPCSFDFVIPEGGFAAPPVTCSPARSADYPFAKPITGTDKIRINVLDESPAVRVDGSASYVLVDWTNSGIDSAHVELGDVPAGALNASLSISGATIVCSLSGHYPADTLVVTGYPVELGAPSPAYGAHGGLVPSTRVALSAGPEATTETNGYRGTVQGYKVSTYDAADAQISEETFNGASGELTFAGVKTYVTWLWGDLAVRVTAAADPGGTITMNSATGWYDKGETVTLTCNVAEGSTFIRWAGDLPDSVANATATTISFTADRPRAILAAVSTPSAPVYLNARATGAGTGTSFANGFTDAAAALSAAGAKGVPLYVAEGVYAISSTLLPADGFEIYGGFPADDATASLADRDPDLHPSVFFGDIDFDDTWEHVVPVEGGFDVVVIDTGVKLVEDGRLNLPPAYTGEHDIYWPNNRNPPSYDRGLRIPSGVGGLVDGLTFAGFTRRQGNTYGEGAAIDIRSGMKSTTVRNCRFYGNTSSIGTFYVAGNSVSIVLDGCRFMYGRTTGRASAIASHGQVTVTNCLFESLGRTSSTCGNVLYWWGGNNFNTYGGVFTRNLDVSVSGADSNYGGPANIVAAEGGSGRLVGCVVTNNYTAMRRGVTAAGNITPLMRLVNSEVLDCTIAGNYWEVDACPGLAYPMIYIRGCATLAGCTIASNTVAIPSAAQGDGHYVVSIAGNGEDAARQGSFVNCVFDSNVVGPPPAGAEARLSRAISVSTFNAANMSQVGIANCTFLGPWREGIVDILQDGEASTLPLVVANSIFTASGTTVYNPFRAATPRQLALYDNTIKNLLAEPEAGVCTGHFYDDIPFADGYVPAARTPGIRDTADVATNRVSFPLTFAFRPRGATAWQPLVSSAGGLDGSTRRLADRDLHGNARTAGSFTRGAVQPLTDTAENGTTLTLRRDPLLAGDLSDDRNAQATATGGPTVPVTALPASANVVFDGWYDEGGALYSDSATLEIASLAADTILTARFTSPPVSLTFDLGDGGVFEGTASSTASVEGNFGAVFPAVPAYAESEDWLLEGWDPPLPETVPPTNATYTARLLTKAIRVVRVVPADEAPAVQDGTSWETAYADLATAYADAGRYRGEVWLKGGLYRLPDGIPMLSNVKVIGGFAGVEAAADEADPAAHPTVIHGDVKADDYWLPNNANPADAARQSVWYGTDFNLPPLSPAVPYWTPGGNSAENIPFGFFNNGECATNCVFRNLAFGGFRLSAIYVSSPLGGIAVEDCAFLGCNAGSGSYSAVMVIDAPATILRCAFTNNIHALKLDTTSASAAPVESHVADCLFDRSYPINYDAAVYVANRAKAVFSRCAFTAGYNNNGNAQFRHNSSYAGASLRMEDCVFANNAASATGHAGIRLDNNSSTPPTEFVRCRFVDNVLTNATSAARAAAVTQANNGYVTFRDCYFAGNRHELTGGSNPAGSVLYMASGSKTTFVNCTFESNVVSTTVASMKAGTFASVDQNGHLALVNCLVNGSTLSGAAAAEFVMAGGNTSTTLALHNTIVFNGSTGYSPFSLNANVKPAFADSTVSGIDIEGLPTGNNGYLYLDPAIQGADPCLKARLYVGENGAWARKVGPASPYLRRGHPVWLAADGNYYFRDEEADAGKPWRRIVEKSVFLTDAQGGEIGLAVSADPIPDAFGVGRRAGRIDLGPLRSRPNPTSVFVH